MASFSNWLQQEQERKRALMNQPTVTTARTQPVEPTPQAEEIGLVETLPLEEDIEAEELGLSQSFPLDSMKAIDRLEQELMSEKPSQEMIEMAKNPNINFDFLREVEGFETEGYVPKDSEGNVLGQSGVTVGSGIDLGQWTENSLADMGVSEDVLEKVKPYLGVKKDKAVEMLNDSPLELSEQEAMDLTDTVKAGVSSEIVEKFNKDSENFNFEDLPEQLQTAITSVGFQYGNKMYNQNFWKQVTSGDWLGAYRNLRDFGDKYRTRRNKEADLIRPALVTEYGFDPLRISQIDEETTRA